MCPVCVLRVLVSGPGLRCSLRCRTSMHTHCLYGTVWYTTSVCVCVCARAAHARVHCQSAHWYCRWAQFGPCCMAISISECVEARNRDFAQIWPSTGGHDVHCTAPWGVEHTQSIFNDYCASRGPGWAYLLGQPSSTQIGPQVVARTQRHFKKQAGVFAISVGLGTVAKRCPSLCTGRLLTITITVPHPSPHTPHPTPTRLYILFVFSLCIC